jgi:uncharacterized protein with PIN domain
MEPDFKRYISDQLETMARDIGSDCRGDIERENVKVQEWVEKNAARFRAEWIRCNGTPQQGWSGRCDGAS